MLDLNDIEQRILDFLIDTDNDPIIENNPSTLAEELSLSLRDVLSALSTLEKKDLVAKSEIWTPTDRGMIHPHQ